MDTKKMTNEELLATYKGAMLGFCQDENFDPYKKTLEEVEAVLSDRLSLYDAMALDGAMLLSPNGDGKYLELIAHDEDGELIDEIEFYLHNDPKAPYVKTLKINTVSDALKELLGET